MLIYKGTVSIRTIFFSNGQVTRTSTMSILKKVFKRSKNKQEEPAMSNEDASLAEQTAALSINEDGPTEVATFALS